MTDAYYRVFHKQINPWFLLYICQIVYIFVKELSSLYIRKCTFFYR